MHTKMLVLLVRLGGGTRPSVIAAGEAACEIPYGGWVPATFSFRLLHLETIPGAGGLAALIARLGDVRRQLAEKASAPNHSLDVTLDITSEPMAADALAAVLPGARVYQTVTGALVDDPAWGLSRVGREALLSELRWRLARGGVEVSLGDRTMAESFRKALDQAAARAPKVEAEGLPLVEVDTADDLVMAAALAAWRAYRHPAIPPAPLQRGAYLYRSTPPLRRNIGNVV